VTERGRSHCRAGTLFGNALSLPAVAGMAAILAGLAVVFRSVRTDARASR
jgi:hypothetical protein